MPGIIPIFFWRFHGFSQLAQSSWRLGLILSRAAAEIARARGICHRSGSRTLWRHAGSLTNAGAPDERVSGVLIKRCGPPEAVALLELQKRPLCLRAYNAVERAIVEPDSVKLYLRPPDVVFREARRIQPVLRRSRCRIRNVIGVGGKIQSGTGEP